MCYQEKKKKGQDVLKEWDFQRKRGEFWSGWTTMEILTTRDNSVQRQLTFKQIALVSASNALCTSVILHM